MPPFQPGKEEGRETGGGGEGSCSFPFAFHSVPVRKKKVEGRRRRRRRREANFFSSSFQVKRVFSSFFLEAASLSLPRLNEWQSVSVGLAATAAIGDLMVHREKHISTNQNNKGEKLMSFLLKKTSTGEFPREALKAILHVGDSPSIVASPLPPFPHLLFSIHFRQAATKKPPPLAATHQFPFSCRSISGRIPFFSPP